MAMTLYHNPRCSKSRAALALLEERGARFEVVRYLDEPPSEETLRALAKKLGLADVRGMMRAKEAAYKEQSLAEAGDDALFAAMAATPILIERPILESDHRAVIARPPERVLALL